ncbi:ABC transporter permease [Gilvimarinus sp. F26214L]|uniref:ABC transporter permease n=1 Tax=Gilvimarinus sp. DZF01 TaxID=3461371 RepID=UPI0040461DC1
MASLAAILYKEFLLLVRDLHGLLLMFAMPVVFIVIMSLAMQQNFAALGGARLQVLIHDRADNEESAALVENLSAAGGFQFVPLPAATDRAALRQQVEQDDAAFLLTVDDLPDSDDSGNPVAVDLLVAPGVNKQTEAIFVMAMQEVLRGLKVERMLADQEDSFIGGGQPLDELAAVALTVDYAYSGEQQQAPSAVQQSVPAWLVFAMFFVVVPLSNTLIRERQFGTLRRLRTIAVPPWQLVAGKLIPYFVVMQVQVACMLAVGVYLIPLLGGDRLHLGSSWSALMLIAAAASIAALGYAVFIAAVARTTEQATTLGGAGNIILAALGGIMVPLFLMPATMQQIGQLSPMAWGLEGFLDVLLRNGGLALVWPKALALTLFGLALTGVALAVMTRARQV